MPKLRFKGFTDDWEQRKFGEFAQRQSETRMSDNEVPCVEYEDVIAEQGVLNKNIRARENNKTGIVFSEDDVLYGKLRPYLHNWLNPDFKGVAVGDWWVLKPQDMDKNFLYRLLQTPQFDDAANQSTGTKMPRADWKLISNLEFRVPGSIEEQAKLGKHFNNLDNLITLHQRKCDELQKVKKYMLQKMFPKKGEKVPEIRLAGFTGDWEQRKLGDIAECLDNMRIPLNAEEREKIPGDIPYYGAGNIQGYINKHLFEEDLVLLLEDGDAFDDYQTKSIAQYVTGKSWVNNHAHVLRPLGDSYFLYSTLAHKDIRQWTQLAGASRKKLVQEAMLNIDIAIPNKDEQNKVGNVFRELDNLITLHQRKHDTLKEIKKYMLQNMFPKK